MILALLAPVALASPSADFQEKLSGLYEAAVTDQQVEVLTEAAIDRAVASLPWAFRPFARPSLRRAADLCQRTRIHLTATHFEAACLCPADEGFSYPVHGPIPSFEDDGEEYSVTLAIQEGQWVSVRYQGPRGGLGTRWSVDGGGILIEKRVFSTSLPEDMVWTIPYVRVR